MSMENVRFEERRGVDGGDPGKLAYLHNADWQPKPFVAGFKVNQANCPGCLFPDAKPGKWPHVKDKRCKVWRKEFADYLFPPELMQKMAEHAITPESLNSGGKAVACAACGGPMFVKNELLGAYYDIGLQHPKGQCAQ